MSECVCVRACIFFSLLLICFCPSKHLSIGKKWWDATVKKKSFFSFWKFSIGLFNTFIHCYCVFCVFARSFVCLFCFVFAYVSVAFFHNVWIGAHQVLLQIISFNGIYKWNCMLRKYECVCALVVPLLANIIKTIYYFIVDNYVLFYLRLARLTRFDFT